MGREPLETQSVQDWRVAESDGATQAESGGVGMEDPATGEPGEGGLGALQGVGISGCVGNLRELVVEKNSFGFPFLWFPYMEERGKEREKVGFLQ